MYRYKAIKVKGRRIDEHRLVIEKHLDRQLKSNEIVHHINENGRDNSITNLQIMSRSEHTRLHFPDFGNESSEIKRLRAIKSSPHKILQKNDIQKIILLLKKKDYTQKKIAEMFNVSRRTIRRIEHGQHWSSSLPALL